jgi:hypothetical protein
MTYHWPFRSARGADNIVIMVAIKASRLRLAALTSLVHVRIYHNHWEERFTRQPFVKWLDVRNYMPRQRFILAELVLRYQN